MLASCEESVEFSGNLLDFLSESLMLCSWGVGMSEIESADLDEFAKQRDAAIEEVERLRAEIAAADAALDKYVGPHGWLDDSRPERIKKLEMLRDEAAAHADAFFKECGKVKEEIQGLRASIKHCDGCGGSWLDDGLNEGCACDIRVKAMELACGALCRFCAARTPGENSGADGEWLHYYGEYRSVWGCDASDVRAAFAKEGDDA